MKFTCRFFLLALFASVSICSTSTLHAQGAPPLVPLVMVSFADEQLVHLHGHDGQFPPLTANPGETGDVHLHFPAVYAGTPLVIAAMDGGYLVLTDQSTSIDSQGRASFQFQTGVDPGVYRVLIMAGSTPSLLQFSVPSP